MNPPANIFGSWGVAEWLFVIAFVVMVSGSVIAAYIQIIRRLDTKRQRLDAHDKELSSLTASINALTKTVEAHQSQIAVLESKSTEDRLWKMRIEQKIDQLYDILSAPRRNRSESE